MHFGSFIILIFSFLFNTDALNQFLSSFNTNAMNALFHNVVNEQSQHIQNFSIRENGTNNLANFGLNKPTNDINYSSFPEKFNYKQNSKFSNVIFNKSWNLQGSLNHLRHFAYAESKGQCAKSIRLALANGGIYIKPVPSAKLLGPSLTQVGFVEIPKTSSIIAGDIVVIEPHADGADGHSAMFDGKIWISDFKQQDIYPGASYLASKPNYKLYRLN